MLPPGKTIPLLLGAMVWTCASILPAGEIPKPVELPHLPGETRKKSEVSRKEPVPPEQRKSPWADQLRTITAVRVEKGPVVDGRLDDECWKVADDGGPLFQILPYQGVEPSFRTEFRIVYDSEFLYVGVACHDPSPSEIVALEMVHDGNIESDDHVVIAIDTFLDRRNGYEFMVNPNGARGDALINDNVNENTSWDGIWIAASTIDSEGWKAEMAIPFKTVSFDPGVETWGFNLLRGISRLNQEDRWMSSRPDIDTYNVAEAGNLAGLKGLQQGVGLDIIPYALGRYSYQNDQKDSDFTSEFGADLRYRITPNLTSSVSYNTDFAETEVDARQINLSRFPLFFPEKRAFFLEESGIFSFGGLSDSSPVLPFFSRRIGLSSSGEIVPIVAAGKLTGRVGGFNLGVVNALLEANNGLDMKNAFVGRVSKNVLEQSSVGLIATHGDPNSESENLTVGTDVGYRTSKLWGGDVLQGNAFLLGSFTEGMANADNKSFGSNLSLGDDLYNVGAEFYQVEEDFNPALGFLPRKGVRAYFGSFRYRPRPRAIESVRQLYFVYLNSHYTDLSDRLDTASHTLYPLLVSFHSGDSVSARVIGKFDSPEEPFEISPGVIIPPGDYWWPEYRFGIETASKRTIALELDYGLGEFYDGTKQSYSAEIILKPIRYLLFQLEYSLNRIQLPQGDFDTRLASVRIQASLTPDLGWSNFVQYDNISDAVGFQSRITWEFRPGTKAFLVLNQNIDRDGGDLTWIQSDLTAKVGVTLRF